MGSIVSFGEQGLSYRIDDINRANELAGQTTRMDISQLGTAVSLICLSFTNHLNPEKTLRDFI